MIELAAAKAKPTIKGDLPNPPPGSNTTKLIDMLLSEPSTMPARTNILSCQFINYLQNRKVRNVDLAQQPDWVKGAVQTTMGAGNPGGSCVALCPAAVDRMAIAFSCLVDALRDEPIAGQSTFEQVFFDTATQVERAGNPGTDTSLFTFGRAQKFITISLKYSYAWWFCMGKASPQYGDLGWIERWAPYLHVPIDAFTLRHLGKIPAFRHVTTSGKMPGISWKWHLSKSRYCRIQDAIRQLAAQQSYDHPMEYEMDKIWTAGQPQS